MIHVRFAVALMLAACTTQAREPAAPSTEAATCGLAESYAGGEWLSRDDATLWYSARGPVDAPAVVFLHGGPGYNGYVFERAVGDALTERVRLVVLDQRGCGRSANLDAEAELGLDATLDDLEALRRHLGIERWTVLGHSFGGLLAAAYALRHPDSTAGVILVETTPSLPRALEHQLQTTAAAAPERWPDHADAIAAVANGDGRPFDRLLRLYGLTGRESLQALLHWHDPSNQARADRWDEQSGLLQCTRPRVLEAFAADGLLDGERPTWAGALPRPGVLIGGARSNVIGEAELTRAAESWGVDRLTMAESGHFPYVEEPAAFVEAVHSAAETFHDPP